MLWLKLGLERKPPQGSKQGTMNLLVWHNILTLFSLNAISCILKSVLKVSFHISKNTIDELIILLTSFIHLTQPVFSFLFVSFRLLAGHSWSNKFCCNMCGSGCPLVNNRDKRLVFLFCFISEALFSCVFPICESITLHRLQYLALNTPVTTQ